MPVDDDRVFDVGDVKDEPVDGDTIDTSLNDAFMRARKRKVIFLLVVLVLASISLAVLRLLLAGP